MQGTNINLSESELRSRISQLPSNVQEGLRNGSLKIVDSIIYSTKVLDSGSKELMSAADNKVEGITNINNRKLEALNYFLLDSIRLQTATVNGSSDADLAKASFDEPADFVANGELEILVAGKTAFPRNSCQIFKGSANDPAGLYKLNCKRLFAPQSEIVPTLRVLSSSIPSETTTAVRVELIGAMIIPA